MSKINFFKKYYFNVFPRKKNIFKSNHYHNFKHYCFFFFLQDILDNIKLIKIYLENQLTSPSVGAYKGCVVWECGSGCFSKCFSL